MTTNKHKLSIKGLLRGVRVFYSYLFWPQKRQKEEAENSNYSESKNDDNMIRIVQISDIHWTVSSPWEEQFAGLKSAFLKEMENISDAGICVDYLFICGKRSIFRVWE